MKPLVMLFSTLVFSAATMASTPNVSNGVSNINNGESNKWVKVFSLSIERSDDQYSTNYMPSSSNRLDIFASTDMKKKRIHAVKSTIIHDDISIALSDSTQKIEISRGQYLSLLDLAARQSGDWESLVYDISQNCGSPRVVKHLYFNGKKQSILSSCGKGKRLAKPSEGMLLLTDRLESLLKYGNPITVD